MKEKPILFSTPMVQAILDGRKTQTRRIFKGIASSGIAYGRYEDWNGRSVAVPYKVGDILWVRETTYQYGKWVNARKFLGEGADGDAEYRDSHSFCLDKTKPVFYPANFKTDNDDFPELAFGRNQIGYFQRPSIFMPKEAARIWLKVTDVRVERLQDISEEDVMKEGHPFQHKTGTPIYDFMFLWNSLNAKRGYSWESNPWVWVIEFDRIEK